MCAHGVRLSVLQELVPMRSLCGFGSYLLSQAAPSLLSESLSWPKAQLLDLEEESGLADSGKGWKGWRE